MKTKSHSQDYIKGKNAIKRLRNRLGYSVPDISKEQETRIRIKSIMDEFGIQNYDNSALWTYINELIKQGRKDYEKELMIKDKFHTSMNRKVCYDAGFQEGRKQLIKLLQEIKDKKLNYTCPCVTCIELQNKIKKELQ